MSLAISHLDSIIARQHKARRLMTAFAAAIVCSITIVTVALV